MDKLVQALKPSLVGELEPAHTQTVFKAAWRGKVAAWEVWNLALPLSRWKPLYLFGSDFFMCKRPEFSYMISVDFFQRRFCHLHQRGRAGFRILSKTFLMRD